jgi:hypothetical protein
MSSGTNDMPRSQLTCGGQRRPVRAREDISFVGYRANSAVSHLHVWFIVTGLRREDPAPCIFPLAFLGGTLQRRGPGSCREQTQLYPLQVLLKDSILGTASELRTSPTDGRLLQEGHGTSLSNKDMHTNRPRFPRRFVASVCVLLARWALPRSYTICAFPYCYTHACFVAVAVCSPPHACGQRIRLLVLQRNFRAWSDASRQMSTFSAR